MRVITDIYVNLKKKKHGQSIVRVDHKLTCYCDGGGGVQVRCSCTLTVAVLVKFANNEIPRGNLYMFDFRAYIKLEHKQI